MCECVTTQERTRYYMTGDIGIAAIEKNMTNWLRSYGKGGELERETKKNINGS